MKAMAAKKKPLPKSVGPYTIKDRLGEGGMGEVLMGEHASLGRRAAIKRLLPEMAENAEMVERFTHEGKALAALGHHGICQVYDLFQQRGSWFMVLEYVDGYDLAYLVKAGPLPVDVAAIVCLKVAEALEHAHFHRILHRDIKPANVMVSRAGEVKLMDFGIALVEEFDRLTKTGLMVGTPMYMAPEVIAGGDTDERADVYALGAMLYQCLSGRKLFAHANRENLYALIEQGKYPPLRKVAPGVPRMLRRIVEGCLEKRPERRYPGASEVRADLEHFLKSYSAWASHTERLVSFLHADGHLSEDEALTCIDADQLIISREIELKPPRSVATGVAAVILIALLSAAAGIGVAAQTGALDDVADALKEASDARETPAGTPDRSR
jgi:serine/threonine protein kinase